jgi:hypothetical protein
MKRDLRRLLDAARARGWSATYTGAGHWKLRHRSGAVVFTSSTPSCPRGLLNFRATLRHAERCIHRHEGAAAARARQGNSLRGRLEIVRRGQAAGFAPLPKR